MKNSHLIISDLKNARAWSKLKETSEISKLINSLTLEVRKYISFAHKKEQILYVALTNPNLCAEFNTYTAPTLLEILHSLKEHFPLIYPIKQIRAYYPQPLRKIKPQKITKENLQTQLKTIKTYKKRREFIQELQAKGAISFLPPKHFSSYNEILETFFLQSYCERSNGKFIIHTRNPKLKSIFESIRQNIQNAH